jgi:hypothetical protein
VVDDNQFNIMAAKVMIFENFHMGVDQANNGQIAVQMYKEGFER